MKKKSEKSKPIRISVVGVGHWGIGIIEEKIFSKNADHLAIESNFLTLKKSRTKLPVRVQIGKMITSNLAIGKKAAINKHRRSIKDEREDVFIFLSDLSCKMSVGSTKEILEKILKKKSKPATVLLITRVPFMFEGLQCQKKFALGVSQVKCLVNSILILPSQRLLGEINMTREFSFLGAFGMQNEVISQAAKSILDVLNSTKKKIDLDLIEILKKGGLGLIGSGSARGNTTVTELVYETISSPLLNDTPIEEAKYILIILTIGSKDKASSYDGLKKALISKKVFINARVLLRVIKDKKNNGLNVKIFGFGLALGMFEVLRINGYFDNYEIGITTFIEEDAMFSPL